MNIVVCDDVKADMVNTARMIKKYFQLKKITINLVLYKDAESLLKDEKQYDLYFLDIILGNENGINIAKNILKKYGKATIFLMSTSNDYILDGYKVRAIRYFIKPLIWEDFSYELNEALNYLFLEEEYISVESNPGEKLYLSTVLYLEKSNRKVIFNTYGSKYVSKRNISDWYNELKNKNFIMPYKGIIVNLANIARIEKDTIILKNSKDLPISRNYIKNVREKFYDFLIEEGRKL